MTEMNKKTDQLTDEQRTCLAKASRHDVNGWIYVKVQGMVKSIYKRYINPGCGRCKSGAVLCRSSWF